MIKTIKKIILSLLSVLGVSFLVWVMLLLNPSLLYSNSTKMENVTIYHNSDLEVETEGVIENALKIVASSDIYKDQFQITMCMNGNSIYPFLNPFAGATAYAFLNKTVLYNCKANFKTNRAEFEWEINNYESRAYNLTALLAHEFMHNVQYDYDTKYQISSTLGSINWKLEGHAEYIAREFKNDGKLKEKIKKNLIEMNEEHVGVPVFEIEDGTIQNLSYYKYAIVVQYLMEIRKMSFGQICKLEDDLEDLYSEMGAWSKK